MEVQINTKSVLYRWAIGLSMLPMCATLAYAQVPVLDEETHKKLVELTEVAVKSMELNAEANGNLISAMNAGIKAQGNINQTLANSHVASTKGALQVEQIRRNADVYSPETGAKPPNACDNLSSSISIKKGTQTQAKVVNKLNEISEYHINTNRRTTQAGENTEASSSIGVMNSRHARDLYEQNTGQSLPLTGLSYPISNDASIDVLALQQRRLLNIAVPVPALLPIDLNPSNMTLAAVLATSKEVIKSDQQTVVTEMINEYVAARTKVYDQGFIVSLLNSQEFTEGGISGEQLESLSRGASEREAMSVLSNYRTTSPQWRAETLAETNEIGLQRDLNIMVAQLLYTQNELLEITEDNNLLLALLYAQSIE